MDCKQTTESDASSTNEEFIDMDAGEENVIMMSDGEVQAELEVIKRWSKALELKEVMSEGPKTLRNFTLATLKNHSVVETPEQKSTSNHPKIAVPREDDTVRNKTKTLSNAPLATPKIPSVVVIPEPTLNRPNVAVPRCGEKVKTETKMPKRSRNRNGSTKNQANESNGSLKAMLSKGSIQGRFNESKPTDKHTNKDGTGTPNNVKRIRSAETTPETNKGQPNKLTKQQGGEDRKASKERSKYSLLERRTLNLKVSSTCRPLTGIELRTIKQFLKYQIEQSLADRKEFIPIFTEPCKIGQDGVYVYCADQNCALWVTHMAMGGIPDVPIKLAVLPHETQLQFDPNFVNVRVVTTIPTKKPKDMILNDLAQLNKDLNIESWRITNIRPKGSSSSTVFMRIDKRSFDTISAREDNKVNWILGPISFKKEIHKARPKKSNPQSATDRSVATPSSEATDRHFKPPSVRSVEATPEISGLTGTRRPEPTESHRAAWIDGHPQDRHRSLPKSKTE